MAGPTGGLTPGPSPEGRPGPGSRIGPYVLEQTLDEGPAGTTWAALDERLGRRVALRLRAGTEDARQRVEREARLLGSADSPHVVAVFDHGVHEGHGYLVTQFAAGGDLARLLAARGALAPGPALQICEQVAHALTALHAAGAHGVGLRPAEVLLRDERGDRPHVFLGEVDGSAHADGRDGADGIAGDLVGVGALLWECLTGVPPYPADAPGGAGGTGGAVLGVPQLPGHDEITAALNTVLARCFAPDPAQRYRDAESLRRDLRETRSLLSTPQPMSALPPVPGAAAPRRPRRRVLAVVGTAGLVVVLTAGGVVLATRGDDAGDTGPRGADGTGGTTTGAAPTPGPVHGDTDGDGLGDVLLVDGDGVLLRYPGLETGGFGAPQEVDPDVSIAFAGPIDTDATTDVLGVEDPYDGTVEVRVVSGPTAPPATLGLGVDLGSAGNEDADPPDLTFGDVDGDGAGDLVSVITSLEGGAGSTRVLVARGDGAGGFGAPEEWADLPALDGTILDRDYVAGDVDGDGLADLVHQGRTSNAADPTITVLRSTGTAFADPGPTRALGTSFGPTTTLADVDGDAAADLVVVDPFSGTVRSARFESDRFLRLEPVYARAGGVSAALSPPAVSDVDGDGDDEVVLVEERRLVALDATGRQWTPLATARPRRVDADAFHVVDLSGESSSTTFY